MPAVTADDYLFKVIHAVPHVTFMCELNNPSTQPCL